MDDSRVLLSIIQDNGFLKYSELLDFLENGTDEMKNLYIVAKTKKYRYFLRAYLESKRKVIKSKDRLLSDD